MITVPAHRVKQFGVEFFQASFSAKDIDRLVKFEVLGYGGDSQPPVKGKQRVNRARVNWEALEKRIGESETAYQRPVIRRKIDELVNYYRTALKQRGELVYEVPATHSFDVGRYNEDTMAFPPGVVIKDFQSDVSPGYPNPKPGGQPARFPTVIQIVPVTQRQ